MRGLGPLGASHDSPRTPNVHISGHHRFLDTTKIPFGPNLVWPKLATANRHCVCHAFFLRMKRLRKSQKSCNTQRSLRSSNSLHVLEVVRHHLGCRRRGTICGRAAPALHQRERESPGSGASHKGAPPAKPTEHGGLPHEFRLTSPWLPQVKPRTAVTLRTIVPPLRRPKPPAGHDRAAAPTRGKSAPFASSLGPRLLR